MRLRLLYRVAVPATAFLLGQGCSPSVPVPGTLPARPGAYPRTGAMQASAPAPRRDSGWRDADWSARLVVDADLAGLLAGLPPVGSPVPVRRAAWPAPVRLTGAGDRGATVHGDWIEPGALAQDVRCGQGPDAGTAVRMVAELEEHGAQLVVVVRYEGPEPLACELSSSGRRRLQSAAADLYLWVRSVARAGTELPAPPR